VTITREKLVLSAVLALAFACRLDRLLETPRPPGLGVAPSRVAESADSGSGEVRSVPLTVSSTPSRTLAWTAHSEGDSAWLALTDTSGSTPATLEVRLDPGDRRPGTYRAAIIVVPDDSAAPSVRVPVELRIDRVAPTTGALSVIVHTTGNTPDPNGYTVTVDGAQSRPVAIEDTITYTGVATGTRSVQLGGLAPNCSVPAGATRPVVVAAGQTATVTFSVSCPSTPPPTGNLKVKASTTGATPDPNGYTVTIDGDSSRTIMSNDSTTYTLVAGTSYLVELGDVASNCTVTGGPSQTKTVIAGQTVTAAFTVTCPTPPPPTGDLTVTTSTTGSSFDPNGYTVAVDGGTPRSIAINNSTGITFTGLTPTSHTVVLGDVASNCTVSGGPSQTKTVVAGQTVTASFTVTCATTPPPTGDLTVSATTTGGTPDPNGYTVTVNGDTRTILSGQSTTYTLAPGSYTVALGDVASNCTVTGGPSQTKTVTAGQTVAATFAVDCPTPPPPTGNLTVGAATTGATPDPNGYTVTLDGGQLRNIGNNGSTPYTGLTPGSHVVTLGDVASNCTVSGGASHTVTIVAGQTTTETFAVDCPTPPPPPNQTPSVDAGPDRNAVLAVLFTLGASFSDPDNGPWSFTIDWGDGSSSSGNASSQGAISGTHTYVLPGSYVVRVTVRDSLGATGSDEMILTVAL